MARILLIPGLLCDGGVWRHVQEALGGRALVADLSTQASIASMAADCLALAEGPLAVAGHSMGGRVAMEMARMAPDRMERLALLDTGTHPLGRGEAEKRRAAVRRGYEEGMEALAEQWLPGMVHGPNRRDGALMDGLRAMVVSKTPELHERQINALVGRPDASAYIGSIEARTLVVVGAEDAWSPPAQHEEIRDAMPNAVLEVVPDAGHFAQLERPGLVTPLLAGFLS